LILPWLLKIRVQTRIHHRKEIDIR